MATAGYKVLVQKHGAVPVPHVCNKALSINAANGDPTHTTMLRRAFAAEASRRYKTLSKLIRTSIVENDVFGLLPPPTHTNPANLVQNGRDLGSNADFRVLAAALPVGSLRFATDAGKVKGFTAWLHDAANQEIFSLGEGTTRQVVGDVAWANVYIDRGYKRGMKRADTEMIKAKVIPEPLFPRSIVSAFNTPIHADSVGLIYTRVYSDLVGVTAAMETTISQRLATGLAQGHGPRAIARRLVDAIEKSGETLDIVDAGGHRLRAVTRARIIARTEVVRAHHKANINTYREAQVEGVHVRAEWSTAGDQRVCPDCAFMEGMVFTLDEIEELIPLHPQCRCCALPLTPSAVVNEYDAKHARDSIGGDYVRKDGTFTRRGFYESITGKPTPAGVPKPGVRIPAEPVAPKAKAPKAKKKAVPGDTGFNLIED